MTINTSKKRDVKYFGRDFDSSKKDLIAFLKSYYPKDWRDFGQASLGVALLELMSYSTDVLSLYQDHAFNEHFLFESTEKKSLEKTGRLVGWVPPGKSVSSGIVDLYIEVPATDGEEELVPDMSYAPIVNKGTQYLGQNGVTYEQMENVDFTKTDINNSANVRTSQYTAGIPTHFILKSSGSVIGATTEETTITVGPYQKFRRVMIPATDIINIVSVYDSNSNRYYEVDYLAQDQVFYIESNDASDKDLVPYVLKVQLVPYRFVMERDIETGRVYMRFGNGSAVTTNDDYLVPDIGDVMLPLYGKDTFTDFQLDPRNFITNDTFGLCPTSTTLTVRYRKGGGLQSNAVVGDITRVGSKDIVFTQTGLDSNEKINTNNSLEVNNSAPIDGGLEPPNILIMKEQIAASHAAQSRMVSKEDFIMRLLSLPAEVGRVFKVGVVPDNYGQSTRVYVLSRDRYGYLTAASSTLKDNIKSYLSRFRAFGGIDMLNANIINISLEIKVVVSKYNNRAGNTAEVLEMSLQKLKDYFDIRKWSIGQPIVISDIVDTLSDVDGIFSVYDVMIKNKAHNMDGREYSNDVYNINANIEDGILRCNQNSIFEIRYLDNDIILSAKQ